MDNLNLRVVFPGPNMWDLALNVAGGVLAGVVALSVGGVGVHLQLLRSVKILAQGLDDVQDRLEREIKRRNAESAPPRPRGGSTIDVLEAIKGMAPPENANPTDRREILKRFGG